MKLKAAKAIAVCLVLIIIIGLFGGSVLGKSVGKSNDRALMTALPSNEEALALKPDQLIRFHVLANSDSEQDQALKRAVRDAILKEVSPKLAVSRSLAESREIIKEVRPRMESIARSVIKAWGKDYSIHTEYGHFGFPTKSYGSLVLPAGNYEALRVIIGEGQGSNWWCVLFPPLCFVDIEHSTAVQVDGKLGIPLSEDSKNQPAKPIKESGDDRPKVHFYFWDLITKLF